MYRTLQKEKNTLKFASSANNVVKEPPTSELNVTKVVGSLISDCREFIYFFIRCAVRGLFAENDAYLQYCNQVFKASGFILAEIFIRNYFR